MGKDKDIFAGHIKDHPFPDDYDSDNYAQLGKYMTQFINPMMYNWGDNLFNASGYRKPHKAIQYFCDYYSIAFDDPIKREKFTVLFATHLSDIERSFTLKDLQKERPDIVSDFLAFVNATKSPDGFLELLGDNPASKLENLVTLENYNKYGVDKALGTVITSSNKALGRLSITVNLLTMNVPAVIVDAVIALIGMKAGKTVSKIAKSAEAKERMMAHMKHYIMEKKIEFDEFAHIIFDGTDIKKN